MVSQAEFAAGVGRLTIPPRKVVIILGVPIDVINMEEALDRIQSYVWAGRQTGKTHQIVTVNTDFIVNAVKDPELRYILQESDMATTDGMPIVWGANVFGFALDQRVTGSDMVPMLAERAAEQGFSVYFLGAAPGIAAKAARVLQEKYPSLNVAGVHSPPFKPILEMDASIIDDIREAKPDILLVAFGNPKQEKWIAMHRYELGVPVMIGIGSTLDFIASASVRAPVWMQKMGLEWLHRLLQDPGRLFRRYVLDFFVFGSLFLRQLWLMKVRHSLPATVPVTEEIIINGIGMLRASGAITIQNHSVLMERASHLLTQTSQLIIDLSDVTFMDSTAIGTVVHLTKELRAAGGDLYLVNAQDPIRMTFQFLYLEHYVNLKKHWGDVVYPDTRQTETAAQATGPAATRQTVDLDGKHWQVVRLPLRFDATSAEAIRLKCGPILESSSNLALDCSETTLLTSAGLSVISELYHKSTGTQSSIMLLDANKDVLKVLRMVKFDQFLSIKNITS